MSLADPPSRKRVFRGTGMAARALRSSAFTVLRFGGQNVLRLASNLVLTRLLFPEAFGIMAIIQVVLAGAAMFSDFGIRAAIIRDERGNEPNFLNTAWTLQILRGFFLGGVIALIAGPLAEFYETPVLADLLLVSALVPVIQGFASTRLATASRTLFIGRMTALHLGAQSVGLLAMIALAWHLQTVWALALGMLVAPALLASLSHVLLPGIRNRIRLERDAMIRLFGFGKYVFLATVAGFFIAQADKAILGKYVTLSELALYNIAFFLAGVPVMLSQNLSKAVLFPLYARRPPSASTHNRDRINQARLLITTTMIGGLTLTGLLGDWLVECLYDTRYHAAGPFMALIAIAALPKVITVSYANLPLAAGASGRYAALLTSAAILQLGFVFLGVREAGVVGAIFGAALGTVCHYPILVLSVRRYGGWDPRHDGVGFFMAAAAAGAILAAHGDMMRLTITAAGTGN